MNTDTYKDEIIQFQDMAKMFSTKRLLPFVEQNDEYPFSVAEIDYIEDMSSLGFFSINLSHEYGGIGCGSDVIATLCLEIAQVDASIATIILNHASAITILNMAAYDGDATLSEIINAGSKPVAFQLYSHINAMSLPVYDNGIINGIAKTVVCGNIADYAIIPVNNNNSISYCCVKIDDNAVIVSEPIVMLGMHACPVTDLHFNNSKASIIGNAEKGSFYFEAMYARMALCAAAIIAGIMKGSFKQALIYTQQRQQGGRAIIHWPQIQMMLSEMKTAIDYAECCLQYLIPQEKSINTHLHELYTKSIFLTLSEMAISTTSIGVQLLGGNGYTKDYHQEKRLRDARQAKSFFGMHSLKKIDYINQYLKSIE
ncbi:MAG TPA: acyl-CoA dehydrogenase family protein [Spirochaetota bacterium]|nr:acyl-CoA dehydrogenase family protein [Spirochaetota bacterium]